MMRPTGDLLEAIASDPNRLLEAEGKKIGRLYTDHGLPLDMAFDRIDIPKQQKLVVLHGALAWLIEHKRNSGATDKAIERQRKANREALDRYVTTGEIGMY
ncbi:MAG TPA: hypothetical protein VFH39_04520 [Candidatus Saccharimonadales bacterium]|nr:hypothetical protein [Candidatus Saccharimonadales bacterium]